MRVIRLNRPKSQHFQDVLIGNKEDLLFYAFRLSPPANKLAGRIRLAVEQSGLCPMIHWPQQKAQQSCCSLVRILFSALALFLGIVAKGVGVWQTI